MRNLENIPLSLYIHIPWCIKKCPYCDFNSHTLGDELPEKAYIKHLIQDLEQQLDFIQQRPIHSIFIGGGTPSLISPKAYRKLFNALEQRLEIPKNTEITLEANPGTVDQKHFSGFYEAGINRLSIGIQSFNAQQLKKLGRIHNHTKALEAINIAKKSGFTNINLDIMHGLPGQNIQQALLDLQTAIDQNTTHVSWYQLTLEPNTLFYQFPPNLPVDDEVYEMQQQGKSLLKKAGFLQYEVSAYQKPQYACQHNLNYWQFGDYLAIGAGAHGKITNLSTLEITRYWNYKHPRDYLDSQKPYQANQKNISKKESVFEFMLNALRLQHSIPLPLLTTRTGLTYQDIKEPLIQAEQAGFLKLTANSLQKTQQGENYLNNLLELFL